MTFGISGLVAAYVMVGVLLLSINLYSRWSWQVKAASVVVVSLFYLVTYFSFPPLLGWPTSASLPPRFHLIAAHVSEPDKLAGDDGVIYLWVSEFPGGERLPPPRAYRLPFSPELHARAIAATTKLRKGLPQLGEVQEAPPERPIDGKQGGQMSVNVEFYDLPDPLLPEK